jgi:hypothetical protein
MLKILKKDKKNNLSINYLLIISLLCIGRGFSLQKIMIIVTIKSLLFRKWNIFQDNKLYINIMILFMLSF